MPISPSSFNSSNVSPKNLRTFMHYASAEEQFAILKNAPEKFKKALVEDGNYNEWLKDKMENHSGVAEMLFIAGAKISSSFYIIKPLTEDMISNAYDNAKFATLTALINYYGEEACSDNRAIIGKPLAGEKSLYEAIMYTNAEGKINPKSQAGYDALIKNGGDVRDVFKAASRICLDAMKYYKWHTKVEAEQASDPAVAADVDFQHPGAVECKSDLAGDSSNDVVDLG